MAKADTFTQTGAKSGSIELPASIFEAKINEPLMAQAVSIYLGNQRQVGAKTQRRSEVSLTTRKWFRQKGTGRARHGAQSAPIFVGGGVAHGPTGMENYTRKLSKKMKQRALCSALSLKLKSDAVYVVKNIHEITKVKDAASLLKTLKLNNSKVTLVISENGSMIARSWRNIANVTLVHASLLHTYAALNSGALLCTEESIGILSKRLDKKEATQTTVTKKDSSPKTIKKESTTTKTTRKNSTKK